MFFFVQNCLRTPTFSIEPKKEIEKSYWLKPIASFDDPYGIRTRVTAVKGRCLNRLTKGPFNWRRRRDLNPRAGYRPTPLAGAPLQPLEYFPVLAPQVGFEPTTDRLTADCSTTELLRNNNNMKNVGLNGLEPSTSRLSGVRSNQLSYRPIKLERVKGIEPTSSAWKAVVLPLNYTRKY